MTNNHGQLDDLVNELDKDIAPKRDLWAGIEQAIEKTPQLPAQDDVVNTSPGKSPYSQWRKVAAMFAPVALVTGIWLGVPSGKDTELTEPSWLTPVTASFELQKKQLLQRVNDSQVISPNWRQTLVELELAEKSLKKALIHQPEDPALMKMLTQIHKQQLELINKTHQTKFRQI